MYINADEFRKEVMFSQKNGKVSDKLAEMFILIAENIATKGCFRGYGYLDDMKSNAILGCVERFKKFNPERSNSNVFSFFSRIVYQGFIRYINKEKTQSDLINKIRDL